jgi:hypothetical protein
MAQIKDCSESPCVSNDEFWRLLQIYRLRLRLTWQVKPEPRQATAMERLQGLFRPAEALRVQAENVDFSTVSCAWCASASGWTLCPNCKMLVCSARSSGGSFNCRDSCGAQFQTAPLETLDAARQGGTPARLAIGRSKQLLLAKGLRK